MNLSPEHYDLVISVATHLAYTFAVLGLAVTAGAANCLHWYHKSQ